MCFIDMGFKTENETYKIRLSPNPSSLVYLKSHTHSNSLCYQTQTYSDSRLQTKHTLKGMILGIKEHWDVQDMETRG